MTHLHTRLATTLELHPDNIMICRPDGEGTYTIITDSFQKFTNVIPAPGEPDPDPVPEPPADEPIIPTEDLPPPSPTNYSKYKVPELRNMAALAGIKGCYQMKKSVLIAALQEYDEKTL